MNKKTAPNLPFLDGLRALAALYVLLHHAVLQYFEFDSSTLSGIKKMSIAGFFYGHLAVNLFIVLSGFCLMLPVIKAGYHVKGGFILFLKKRIVRILPPFYLAILLSVILITFFIGKKTGTHWDYSIPVTYKDILAHVFLVNDFLISYAFKINHSLWSIPVEFRIYLFFPFLVFLWRKIGPGYTFLVSVSISLAMYFILASLKNSYPDINLELAGVNPYIILFTLGMLAAHFSFSESEGSLIHKKRVLETLLFLSFITFGIIEKINQESLSKSSDIAFGMFCFFFLIICSTWQQRSQSNWILKTISWKPFVLLGHFSYSLYLIHAPLLQVLSQYVVDPLSLSDFDAAIVLMGLSIALIIPFAYLFFVLCERPFMNLGRKINAPKIERASVLNPAP